MSLGTEQKNADLGNQMGKLRSMIIKAVYAPSAAPVAKSLEGLITESFAGGLETMLVSGLQLENVKEVLAVEVMDAGLAVFSTAPSASLQANNDLKIDAVSTTGGSVVLRVSYLSE